MKKIILSFLITGIFFSNLYAEKVIGVTAFQNLNKEKTLSWLEIGIAESISLNLRNVKEYIVIDRTNVDKVISEIQLGQSGLIDDNTAKRAGKALNADVLVVGSFQTYGKQIRISAKIVDVESHKVLKQVQSTGMLDNIFDLQDEIALKIIDVNNIEITDQTKKKIQEKYTSNITAYEYYSKGQQFYYKTKYIDAIEMFKKAAGIDKNYSLAYAGLAKSYASRYWQLKNYSNVVDPSLLEMSYENCNKALEITPNLDEAHLSLAKYYQNVDDNKISDKWKKCEDTTKKVLELNPNNGEAYFLMSRIYGYNSEKEEMYLLKALKINDFIVEAHNNLGVLYLNKKKYDLAEKAFRKAIKLDPEYKTAYMNIGVIYDSQGQYEKALDMYKSVVDKYPDYPLGLVNLGIGYRRLNRLDEAIVYFKKAVKIKPDYAFGWGEIGYYYLKKANYDEAIRNYTIALQFDNKNRYSLYNIAFCYSKLKNYDQAIKYYNDTVTYNPDYVDAWSELAYMHLLKQQYQQSIEYYDKALSLDSRHKFSLANKGYCYSMIGEYTKAIEYLNLVLSYYPNYAWPAGHLGWIYRYKLNDNSKALQWYKKALQLEPGNSDYKKNIQELSK